MKIEITEEGKKLILLKEDLCSYEGKCAIHEEDITKFHIFAVCLCCIFFIRNDLPGKFRELEKEEKKENGKS